MNERFADRVSVTLEGGVADVRLDRPDKMNAIDGAMFEGLTAAGRALSQDASVRAVVLSGNGRAFCAGLDMGSFRAMAGQERRQSTENLFDSENESPANRAQRAAWIWQEVPVPVIAAVHGVAFGGGLQIALGADLRYATPDARLSVMEIKWGLVPDMSGTQALRHLVRLDVAKDLTFTGREVQGREAAELGLVTRICDDPLADALEAARAIAQKSPEAIRADKALLNQSVLATLRDGLQLEEKLQGSLIGRPNQVEAVRANLEKRAPNFKDPE